MSKVMKHKKGGVKPPLIANNSTNKAELLQRYNYIPIDYIKCEVIGLDRDYFEQNMILTKYESKKEKKQVNLSYSKHNMKVTVYPKSKTNRIELSGSLHKFINGGKHNYDQFTENKYYQSLKLLKETFGIRPENLKILGLEYGVNISPPIKTNLVLNHILMNRNRVFTKGMDRPGANYNQCGDKRYYLIKIYNKGSQYKLNDEILRIEKKTQRWDAYRDKGIYTLEDFNKVCKKGFVNELLEHWNETVFYDPTNRDLDNWHEYSNIQFWREIRKKSYTTRKNHRDKLKEINKKHGLNVQSLISDEVIKTINSLQGLRNYNFSINPRYCRLTGVNISMQRNDSFLLSHAGLYHLIKHDKQTFESIKNLFLSNLWVTSSLKVQVKEIAHNIRDKYNYRKDKYKGNQLTIFRMDEVKELQVYI